jgi:hypothetical protein
MTNDDVMWTYGVMKADGSMDTIIHKGQIPLAKIREVLGGEFTFVHFEDQYRTVAAVLKHTEGLPSNKHWPALHGDVVIGKMDGDGNYLGMIGVNI